MMHRILAIIATTLILLAAPALRAQQIDPHNNSDYKRGLAR